MRLEQQLEIIVACYALHNFIILHKNNILILTRDLNVDVPPNAKLYDNSNQFAMDIRMK